MPVFSSTPAGRAIPSVDILTRSLALYLSSCALWLALMCLVGEREARNWETVKLFLIACSLNSHRWHWVVPRTAGQRLDIAELPSRRRNYRRHELPVVSSSIFTVFLHDYSPSRHVYCFTLLWKASKFTHWMFPGHFVNWIYRLRKSRATTREKAATIAAENQIEFEILNKLNRHLLSRFSKTFHLSES